jgi:hypothetical protein
MSGEDMEHADIIKDWKEQWQPPLNQNCCLREHQKVAVVFLHSCKAQYRVALVGDRVGVGKV